MRIYNTRTRMKEEFVPREDGKVAMYVCGPTVYNHVHIGNVRTFLSFDAIRRYLIWRGYEVTFVSNITDVDDKIIARAIEEGRSAAEVAEEYTAAFVDITRKLGILDPDIRPRATEEIDTMIDLIGTLVDKGHAYERDGSVYFAVRSFDRYGALSGRDIDEMCSGGREQRGGDFSEDKDDPLDFALWKAAKPDEPAWDSPWGMGRPGWHIECSAMSGKYLGLPLDIHGGGNDLVFPHHENETAQSEAAFDVPFSRYWMHSGMLLIDSGAGRGAEKMSKSLGNFLLAKDVLDSYDPAAVRLLMLQTHYRSPLTYSADRLDEATSSLERLANTPRNVDWVLRHTECVVAVSETDPGLDEARIAARETFTECMDDDFNTAGALGAIYTLVGETNASLDMFQKQPSAARAESLKKASSTIRELVGVLGLDIDVSGTGGKLPLELVQLASDLISFTAADPAAAASALLESRAEARARKDWATADAIRDGVRSLGLAIEDTAQGARLVVSR